MPELDLKPAEYRSSMLKTNPLIWGAISAIVGGAIVLASQQTGIPSSNPLFATPVGAAAVSYFFGWAAGVLKNWYGKRLIERVKGSRREP